MKDVMLDLETLGTRHDAMIIQIGACYFDRNTGLIRDRMFKANIVYGNDGDKFSMDYGTVMWWFTQSEEARASVSGGSYQYATLETALKDLAEFLHEPDVQLWSHATFDMPILANAFATAGLKLPVPFRNMRDLRTLMDLADHRSTLERVGTHHDALADAIYQARYASEAFKKLNGS